MSHSKIVINGTDILIAPLESPALFKTPAISMVTILKEDNKIIIMIIIIIIK